MRSIVITSLIIVAITGCSPQAMLEAEVAKPNPAPPSGSCPAPGTPVPLTQLWVEAPRFVGCDVTTEVRFVMVSQFCPRRLPMNQGDRCIQVAPPNQQAGNFLKVDQATASQFFSAATDTIFQVRGTMAVDLDLGVLAFVASGARSKAAAGQAPATAQQ